MRARSAALCAALLCGLFVGRHSDVVLARLRGLHVEPQSNGPRLPLDVLQRDAEATEAAGQPAEAARYYQKLCAQYPDEPVAERAQLRIAHDLAAAGDVAGADRAFQKFRVLYPDSDLLQQGLLEMASWQYERGDYIDAAHSYTDLIALVTHSDQRRNVEDTAPAPASVKRTRRGEPRPRAECSPAEIERLARFNQALCYQRSGNRDAAVHAYDRFLSRFPEDALVPEANYQMGALLFDASNPQDAVTHFRAAWESPQAQPQFRFESVYRAGLCFETMRRPQDAIATFRLAIDMRPVEDEFRLAAMAELARLIQERDPLRAVDIYRDIAEFSKHPAWRAVALERLASLENESTVAATR